ncbi:hypothetical protein MPTK1_8g12140 [Marchantia polymorpha subsp. ruderalis]|uniref:Uncharacterized protein n=3 Tax=Marchantia polymorpha TaxID=3197 RepID=A0A176W679_MARPO|nr:hypothetical protein AXG93_1335s1010 [Marchantia polymorpha subsp. ruderalis]PTQ47206.1 hypothetical protein MARPO_0008s0002 [Marchantia polymorpha]BBN19620.1 hypothetical protein Mp_8g12140 [Marchantia polymorpha subsp. ruderalis]|eukprot:PTQ47206.1 hypothetical protein MARPO_0008s0002 [Marchantia polymorpha]
MGGEMSDDHDMSGETSGAGYEQIPETDLKYLDFVRIAAKYGTAFAMNLYEVGKENSGALKSRVEEVEGTVKSVVGPIVEKVDGKPYQILQFVDRRVDDTVHLLDAILPQSVKEKSYQATDAAKNVVGSIVNDVQENGVYNTARTYIAHCEPTAQAYGSQAWRSVQSLPMVPQALGTARMGAEKLNQILLSYRDSQLPLSAYVPLLPLNYLDNDGDEPAEEHQFRIR